MSIERRIERLEQQSDSTGACPLCPPIQFQELEDDNVTPSPGQPPLITRCPGCGRHPGVVHAPAPWLVEVGHAASRSDDDDDGTVLPLIEVVRRGGTDDAA